MLAKGGSKIIHYPQPNLPQMTQPELLDRLASLILSVSRPHPVRVAIDGVDGAGKTTLADGLAGIVQARARQVIRGSIDGFHRPRSERLRCGELSPEGYYFDSFDYDALLASLLVPLGPGGDRIYRLMVFDYRMDSPTMTPSRKRRRTPWFCSMGCS